MPTGYTAPLYEGKDIRFEEYAWRCAHAMGALVMLRDEGLDSDVPEFQPSTTYYDELLSKAQDELRAASAWTSQQAQAAADLAYRERLDRWQKHEQEKRDIRRRYENMLALVEKWEPPTAEHGGLKDFMAQQLRESIEFDCKPYAAPEGPNGPEHQAEVISKAQWDVDYARKHCDEEVERTGKRNAWVRQLRDSLSLVAERGARGGA